MDEFVNLLDAKPSTKTSPSNIDLWYVDESTYIKHISKLMLLGMDYPLLIQPAGDELFLFLSFQGIKEKIAVSIKSKDPYKLKIKIIEKHLEFFKEK